jgi:hypothetical protein
MCNLSAAPFLLREYCARSYMRSRSATKMFAVAADCRLQTLQRCDAATTRSLQGVSH